MTLVDPEPIETCSPSKVRKLLIEVLTKSRAINLNFRGGNGGSGSAVNVVQDNFDQEAIDVPPPVVVALLTPTYNVGDLEVCDLNLP